MIRASLSRPLRLAGFTSGKGTLFRSINEHCKSKYINGKVDVLFTSNIKSPVVEYARENEISVVDTNTINNEHFPKLLRDIYNIDYVFLAGYTRKIPKEMIDQYKNKILNIHPSHLPKYGGKGMYGINVHRAVIEAKEPISGSTIHFIDEEYDTGPILNYSVVEVEPDDTPETLQEKVRKEEPSLYCYALRKISQDKIVWFEGEPYYL